LFTLEERLSLAKKSLIDLNNVKVVSFSGLLVDYAYENDIDVIVKGVRNSADFDYENILHQVGDSQKLGIDTFILFARPELAHVSSSVVKGIQKEQGFVHEYVPLNVKQEIERKLSNQFIIGVTGEIGSGKSFVCEQILELCKEKGIEAHNIELDHLGHKILSELKDEKYEKIRNQLIKTFGENIKKSDGTIDRKILGEIVFNKMKN
jgi:pantetheine-phosphate adenylyltransferase